MPNQEREPRNATPEEIALKEVEGYIERIEKQPEIDADLKQAGVQVVDDNNNNQVVDLSTSGSSTIQNNAPSIVLPLSKEEVEEGMHEKIVRSIRWLAETCVKIIKMYPGRVFYKPTEVKNER